jgi:undecaprenyl-diphosphatase
MDLLQAALLGALQGLTEFLPVSSSGHIVIFSSLLKAKNTLYFDIVVHVASLLAIVIFFRHELREVLEEVTRKNFTSTLLFKILAGTAPAAAFGVFFKDRIEEIFETPILAATMLYLTAFLLLAAEFSLKKQKPHKTLPSLKDAIVIGVFQALAILPGISRSGSTIAGGIFTGLDRDAAARFSFLLAIPAILGSLILEIIDVGFNSLMTLSLVVGFLSSVVFSLLALTILFVFIKRFNLLPFAIYCLMIPTLYLILR